jgi:phosphate transport system substrate-binding protein
VTGLLSFLFSVVGAPPDGTLPSDSSTSVSPLILAGEERLAPLVQQWAGAYSADHTGVDILIQGGGTTQEMRRLLQGTVHVVLTDRPITEPEVQRARAKWGREPLGIPVAVEAVVFHVPLGNPVASLALSQIEKILRPAPVPWEELGGTGGEVHLFAPPSESGPIHVLQSRILREKAMTRRKKEFHSDAELLVAVARDPQAIGIAGLADADGVKKLAFRDDAQSRLISPTPAAVQSREYPLAYYLYAYVAPEPTSAAQDFIRFVVSAPGQEIVRQAGIGAVPLPLRDGIDP